MTSLECHSLTKWSRTSPRDFGPERSRGSVNGLNLRVLFLIKNSTVELLHLHNDSCRVINRNNVCVAHCAIRFGLVESRNGTSIIFVLEKDAFVLCYFRSSWIYVRNVLILDYYFFFLRTSFPIQVTCDLTNR